MSRMRTTYVREDGMGVARVAAILGVNRTLVRDWVRRADETALAGTPAETSTAWSRPPAPPAPGHARTPRTSRHGVCVRRASFPASSSSGVPSPTCSTRSGDPSRRDLSEELARGTRVEGAAGRFGLI